MSRLASAEGEKDLVAQVAAEWFTRLQDPGISLDAVAEWQSWMSANPRHAEAFGHIEDLWQDFADVPCPPDAPARALAADRYDASMPIGSWKSSMKRTRTLRLALAASLAAVSLLGVGLWRPWAMFGGEVLQTATGENRTFTLQDGSRVALGGRTTVRVSFSEHARELALVRGEAFFDVARDRARPFSVRAAAARVVAIGTQFNVRRNEDDRVVVAVVEGRVVVERKTGVLSLAWPEARRAAEQKALSAGSRATLDGGNREPLHTEKVASADATAWRSGRLAFESEPLRYVVEDVNRYAPQRIELADERIGDLLITGTVRDDNIPAWLASLQPAFGIRAVEEAGRIVLEAAP